MLPFLDQGHAQVEQKTFVDLGGVTDAAKQRLIAETANAIEGFVNLGCIALGTLQILALNYPVTIWKKYTGWLRTKRTVVPSEEIVRLVIREDFYHNFDGFRNTAIYQIIKAKQRRCLCLYTEDVA